MDESQETMFGNFPLGINGLPVMESEQTAEGQRGQEMNPLRSLHEVHEEWHGLGDFDYDMGGGGVGSKRSLETSGENRWKAITTPEQREL